jgi:hypothetical protein
MESDTNLHIASINLNRDRFDNALTVLGGTSPSKNITPPESPTDPLDDPADLLPPPMQGYNALADDEHHERSRSTVRINDTPTSESPIASPQAEHERPLSRSGKDGETEAVWQPILRNSKTVQPPQQEERQRHTSTNKQGDSVVHDRANKLLKEVKSGHEAYCYHVEDFAGLFPVWPIIELAMTPTGQTMDERMTQFVRCVTNLFGEILIVDEKAAIAPIAISNDLQEDMITDKATIPNNFTKLGKWVMLSGGSWVFNKKDKGSNDVYARFRLKLTVPVEDMVTRISFEFSCMGGSKLYKKQNQAMETETPMMLLFVSNGTDPKSITNDITQMLETAFDSVDQEGMMPEEFEHKEIPSFTLKLNAPRLPSQTKETHKAYDHFKEQGKKAYHCEVAKEDVPYFRFLAGHAHRLKLENKYLGKFAKFTGTLENNPPLSNCTQLRRCMQGHLNFHLSSTSITINGIDNLDASEVLRNTTSGKRITKVTLRDMLYRLTLESGSPLFLQLSQRPSGEVDAVIPNNPKAEMKAERINPHVAAWCINYWKDTNPGGNSFFRKLASKAFCQVLLHEVSDCTWDSVSQTVTSPHAQSEMATLAEFENQDWVQDILRATTDSTKDKAYVDPNVAFPFEDDFSVGTIHGANARPNKSGTQQATGEKGNDEGAIEILDNNDDDDVSVLTTKTQDELVALLVQARKQLSNAPVGSRVASGSDATPGSGPDAVLSQTNADGQESILAVNAPTGTDGNNVGGNAGGGPGGK